MKREILFRGKWFGNDEWVYGALYSYYDFKRWIYQILGDRTNGIPAAYEVYPATVGQFTGLTDVNGKQIFEGDIVRLCESVKLTFGVESGEVRYYRGGFVAGKGNGFNNSLDALADADWKALRGEIIGNIYDNPELLEVNTNA